LRGPKLFTVGINEGRLAIGQFLRNCPKGIGEIGFVLEICNEYENSLCGKLTCKKKKRKAKNQRYAGLIA
jgi:hypothetical protein